jgi:hypothetical protein
MYYRIVLKEGLSLINMRHVREVAQRGPNLDIYYPSITDGRSWGHGIQKIKDTYTYNNEERAKAEFEKIQTFLETAKAVEATKAADAPLG